MVKEFAAKGARKLTIRPKDTSVQWMVCIRRINLYLCFEFARTFGEYEWAQVDVLSSTGHSLTSDSDVGIGDVDRKLQIRGMTCNRRIKWLKALVCSAFEDVFLTKSFFKPQSNYEVHSFAHWGKRLVALQSKADSVILGKDLFRATNRNCIKIEHWICVHFFLKIKKPSQLDLYPCICFDHMGLFHWKQQWSYSDRALKSPAQPLLKFDKIGVRCDWSLESSVEGLVKWMRIQSWSKSQIYICVRISNFLCKHKTDVDDTIKKSRNVETPLLSMEAVFSCSIDIILVGVK